MQGKKESYKFKFHLLGDKDAGKSSLLARLVNNDFKESHSSTDDFKIKSIPMRDAIVKCDIWDQANQEKFRTKLDNPNNSDAIIIVCDLTCRDSFENIDTWINKRKDNKLPIFLVGTKADVIDYKVKPEELEKKAQEYPNCFYLGDTSAKWSINVDESFAKVASFVLEKFKAKRAINGKSPSRINQLKLLKNEIDLKINRDKEHLVKTFSEGIDTDLALDSLDEKTKEIETKREGLFEQVEALKNQNNKVYIESRFLHSCKMDLESTKWLCERALEKKDKNLKDDLKTLKYYESQYNQTKQTIKKECQLAPSALTIANLWEDITNCDLELKRIKDEKSKLRINNFKMFLEYRKTEHAFRLAEISNKLSLFIQHLEVIQAEKSRDIITKDKIAASTEFIEKALGYLASNNIYGLEKYLNKDIRIANKKAGISMFDKLSINRGRGFFPIITSFFGKKSFQSKTEELLDDLSESIKAPLK